MPYHDTTLWKRAFPETEKGAGVEAARRLASEYSKSWEVAKPLVARIGADLKQLTLHDDAHLHAVWERADLIAGADYPLNAAEAFVFGEAVLLHDAGHTVAAYPDGIEGIRQLPQWKDVVSILLTDEFGRHPTDDEMASSSRSIRDRALLIVLREIHAERAKALATQPLAPTTDARHYLISDDDLRAHFGEIVGKIAASHHWDIARLRKLGQKLSPLSWMPADWTVDLIKLACLLRCADAAQIDRARAPDFQLALLQPGGISAEHWKGQNLVAAPQVHPQHQDAIYFRSIKAFGTDDADAWWIEYDAICLADRELQASFLMLESCNAPPFKIRRVLGANQPAVLSKMVEASGWTPVSAEVRVTDVNRLVNLFSGPGFYGRNLSVPLRELIQNAADAIRARRSWETGFAFTGQVVVRVEPLADGEHYDLIVEDNGIGMSQAVLIGPLLDFGNSYWTSNLMRSEFPGLAARRLDQTGRYGIGFFSVFMLTGQVEISSRRYDAGIDAIMTVSFRDALKLRPILLKGPTKPFDTTMSTRVVLHLKREAIDNLLSIHVPRFEAGKPPQQDTQVVELAQLVARMCPTLDCDIYVDDNVNGRLLAHRSAWATEDPERWLRELLLEHVIKDSAYSAYITAATKLTRRIEHNGIVFGRASIGFESRDTGLHSIGHFTTGMQIKDTMQSSDQFVGVIEVFSGGPNRLLAAEPVSPEALAEWATEQARLVEQNGFDREHMYVAAANVANFGGDPTPISHFYVNRNLLSIGEIFDILARGEEVAAPIDTTYGATTIGWLLIGGYHARYVVRIKEVQIRGHIAESIRLGTKHAVQYNSYAAIPDGDDPKPSSFLSCLLRRGDKLGFDVSLEVVNDYHFGNYVGETSARDNISHGMELRGPAVVIRSEPRNRYGSTATV